MKRIITQLLALFPLIGFSQMVTNGNFTAGTTGWTAVCLPEVNPESVYGGVGPNLVAEVDAQVGICQTISGFTPGNSYILSFVASRRTGSCPGPAPVTANISIDNGAYTGSVTRNGAFNLAPDMVFFTATNPTHTLSITPAFAVTTCGILFDDIEISSVLAEGDLSLTATPIGQGNVRLEWTTITETDYFEVERSSDLRDWEKIRRVNGERNAQHAAPYSVVDPGGAGGTLHYRIRQVDVNGSTAYSAIRTLDLPPSQEVNVYPNPAQDFVHLEGAASDLDNIHIVNLLGQDLTATVAVQRENATRMTLDVSTLSRGTYLVRTGNTFCRVSKQ